MDVRYEQFCLVDRLFYDSLNVPVAPGESYLDGREVPGGWQVHRKDVWTVLSPDDARLPMQGWKIHVAAGLNNAAAVLDEVWGYCVALRMTFKFLANRSVLLMRNAKYADRAGSGKFLTIYPVDERELERTLTGLGEILDGQPGPYILGDARWRDGPLHVRYGGFAERYCHVGGERVLAVADPEGRLVPDRRGAGLVVPRWAEVPDFLAPALADRRTQPEPLAFPFQVERALHHSNGGGVYVATDNRDGRRVVLKEARPFAGLDAHGQDAVRRLDREATFLARLSATGVTPELYESFTCWEHEFLSEEYIEGETLATAFVARFPLIHPECTDHDVAEYTDWAVTVLDRVDEAVRILHAEGVVFGDLHPHNIVIQPDGGVRFIDLELASYVTDDASAGLGAPGYAAPDGRTGVDADRYALACLRLSMFLPLTAVLPLDPAKAARYARSAVRRFPIPGEFLTDAVTVLRDRRVPTPSGPHPEDLTDWPALRGSIRDGILASATPARTDRLFPGDIDQFTYNGIGLAHGAAGVLHALARSGAGRYPEHEEWLLDAVGHDRHNGCVGFYDGLHGVAYALAELGRRDDALSVLDRVRAAPLDQLSSSLFGGLPGVALNLLYFAALTGDDSLVAPAIEAADLLAARNPADDPSPRAGLVHGPSGQALLHIRLFEWTGDERFLTFAETALCRDLDRCVVVPDGTTQVDEGWRVMPYLGTGSAGVGLVLAEFLRHREHERFAAALPGIRRAAEPEFIIGSGLFNGRAGLIVSLAADPDKHAVVTRHVRWLAAHTLSFRGHAAFPADQLMRLSMDLATGSSGVLLALGAALTGDRAALPFSVPFEKRGEVTHGTPTRPAADGG